jgi:hypothetical protein
LNPEVIEEAYRKLDEAGDMLAGAGARLVREEPPPLSVGREIETPLQRERVVTREEIQAMIGAAIGALYEPIGQAIAVQVAAVRDALAGEIDGLRAELRTAQTGELRVTIAQLERLVAALAAGLESFPKRTFLLPN